jgi:O-antigen ligase
MVALVLVASFAVAAFDIAKLLTFGGTARYLVFLPVIAAVVVVQRSSDRALVAFPRAPDWVLMALTLYVATGVLVNKTGARPEASLAPLLALLVVALVPLAAPAALGPLTSRHARVVYRGLGWVCLARVLLGAALVFATLPVIGGERPLPPGQTFVLALAGVFALGPGWRVKAPVLAAAAAVVVLDRPSASVVLVAAVTLAVLATTSRRSSRQLRVGVAATAAVAVLGVVVFFSEAAFVARAYDQLVEAQEKNTSTRVAQWSAAVREWSDAPVFGSGFAGQVNVDVGAPLFRRYNVHNDFLTVAMSGGALGLALFLGWLVAALVEGITSHRRMRRSGHGHHARLQRLLVVGLAGWMTCAAVNPLIQNVGAGIQLVMLYAGVRYVAASHELVAQQQDDPPESGREPVPATT